MQFEDDLVTVGGGSLRFPQDKSGDYLLYLINKEIEKAGGRIKVGYDIVTSDPDLFDHKTRMHFKWGYDGIIRQKNERAQRTDKVVWTKAEVDMLHEMWPVYRLAKLEEVLGRSAHSIRIKARNSMTKEQYENRAYNKVKQGEKRRKK